MHTTASSTGLWQTTANYMRHSLAIHTLFSQVETYFSLHHSDLHFTNFVFTLTSGFVQTFALHSLVLKH
jgi:hypothetical protein